MVDENTTQVQTPENNEVQPPQKDTKVEEVKTDSPTVENNEEKAIEIPQEDYRVSPLFYEIANYFGVEEREYENAKDKLSLITDWAIHQANSNKMHDILPIIRGLEDTLTKPGWGESRYGNIYKYLRLATKRDAFDKAMSAYRVNPNTK